MVAAVSAFFWLFVAQTAHLWFQLDWLVMGRLLYVDRIVYVLALVAYGGWLCAVSRAPVWARHVMGVACSVGVAAIWADRAIAMPLIWLLQVAILVVLVLWTHAVIGERWPFRLLLLTSAAHSIGALTYFPLCQLAVGNEWVATPQATYVCDAVLGPIMGSGVFMGAAALAWVTLASLAVRAGARGGG